MTFRRRDLLWVDGLAGATAGVLVLALREWLADLYVVPAGLVLLNACANLLYGSFSLSLAARKARPRGLVVLLVAANLGWALVCAVAAATLTAGILGRIHLVGEAAFVGGLGILEWRWREALWR